MKYKALYCKDSIVFRNESGSGRCRLNSNDFTRGNYTLGCVVKLKMIGDYTNILGYILCTLWPELKNDLEDGVLVYDPTVVSSECDVKFKQVAYLEV